VTRSRKSLRGPTVHDVAHRAGVSQPTVSLVLSGHPTARVAPGTRERVRRAAEELGYRPNVVARGLQQRRSYALGVIVADLRNPFSIDVVSGAERVAAKEGYAVLLCDARERPVQAHLDELHARLIDGVIIESSGAALSLQAQPGKQNLVLVDEPSASLPTVLADIEEAGRLAAKHLVGLGHRSIAFIGPATDLFRYRMMERAFVNVLRQANVPIRSEWFRRAAPSAAGGEQAMLALLARSDRPTAVFCANDLTAIGALKACGARGVSVPDEMSLMGCDDIEMARLVMPELTTIALPARELGARAARLLIRRLSGQNTSDRSPRPLPARLVVRGSTGRI
jgi:DNA-binding LacI/PurR family transcriptional regulator